MDLPATQPGHLGVDRVAHERVPEGGAPGIVLDQVAFVGQLDQPRPARQLRRERELEGLVGDGGHLGGLAGLLAQLRSADHDRVADGVGHRNLALLGQLETGRAGVEPVPHPQGADQLLDEEG